MNKNFLRRSVLIVKSGERFIVKERNISKSSRNRMIVSAGVHGAKVTTAKGYLNRRGRNGGVTIGTTSTGPRNPITE